MNKYILEVYRAGGYLDKKSKNFYPGPRPELTYWYFAKKNKLDVIPSCVRISFLSNTAKPINKELISIMNKHIGWKIIDYNDEIQTHLDLGQDFNYKAFLTYFFKLNTREEIDQTSIKEEIIKGQECCSTWIRECYEKIKQKEEEELTKNEEEIKQIKQKKRKELSKSSNKFRESIKRDSQEKTKEPTKKGSLKKKRTPNKKNNNSTVQEQFFPL